MTIDMVAKVGRSSYLGERSKGRADPGAAFIAFFLRSMSQPE
jgi:dihydroxyacetone kinase